MGYAYANASVASAAAASTACAGWPGLVKNSILDYAWPGIVKI